MDCYGEFSANVSVLMKLLLGKYSAALYIHFEPRFGLEISVNPYPLMPQCTIVAMKSIWNADMVFASTSKSLILVKVSWLPLLRWLGAMAMAVRISVWTEY